MSYSENDMLVKAGDLLVEINEEYAAVQEQEGQLAAVQLGMLAAKSKFLAAHFELLGQFTAKQPDLGSDAVQMQAEGTGEIIFTPATATENSSETNPQNTQEHEETEVSNTQEFRSDAASDPEPVKDEPVEEDVEEPETEHDQQEIEEPEADEQQQVPTSSDRETINTPSVERQTESESSVSNWRASADEERATESVREENAVVNSVVEESRTIELNQPQDSQETTTNTSRPLTLNEMIQQQRRAGLTNANQFKTPATKTEQIIDLKSAVSLNDKLLFIKDLFNGYSLAYTEAIELLNRFDNMAEADAFLQANYSLKNNWASKPQTVEKLYQILQKKFA